MDQKSSSLPSSTIGSGPPQGSNQEHAHHQHSKRVLSVQAKTYKDRSEVKGNNGAAATMLQEHQWISAPKAIRV
ncbi:hypothetical protein JCGZ_02473 [Jatropha curcas]|uniref:Uncharacterized protein n=1 Tax=Jatropha curcas TaxID=180498 RepID=A0A067JDV6_JATCU|nr:hypothetical protein JCGZ_02473 [Jatropha curcas]